MSNSTFCLHWGAAAAYTISVGIVYTAQTFWLQRTTEIRYLQSISRLRVKTE